MMRWFFRLGVFFAVCCTLATGSYAQEFRQLRPIPTPAAVPKGAVPVAELRPVDPQGARAAAEKVLKTWNTGNIEEYLSDEFYDKSRLLDAMVEKVPRDARLRVMSVQGVQTLEQYQRGDEIISTVSVTADTQIEFNDPQKGFRCLGGTNEYILRIVERVK